MAPELLDPNIPDNDVPQPTKASDVYAFAMVVIEVFTGETLSQPTKLVNLILTYRKCTI